MSLREELIREAEASTREYCVVSPEWHPIKESHARLLAFIKGQKDDAYDNGEGFCVIAYTDPETLP